jgi:hypothetical protein
MVELVGPQPRPLQHVGRPSALATRIGRLEESSRQHWPTSNKRMNCVVCHARTKKRRRVQTKCEKCDVELCISGCFKDYYARAQL